MKKVISILCACLTLASISISQVNSVGSSVPAHSGYELHADALKLDAAWPAAVAEAIGLAYAAGFVIGTIAHHAYDRFLFESPTHQNLALLTYDPSDFSQFDN
ncbi:hypothetical protein [Marinoscillum sp.]|uniref:hypothetical protein n=1 Tax=Marinoscillum sp. TaxID=2024838 RepID=UPI003BAC17F2